MTEAIHPNLRQFLWDIQSMVELTDSEREILLVGADLMGRLIASGDFLPAAFSSPSPDGPQQFQLFSDEGQERFSVANTVLGPGEALPVFAEPAWELLGVVAGAVLLQPLSISDDKKAVRSGSARTLQTGSVERLSPRAGQTVQLKNASHTETAVCIHAYGGEAGKRMRFFVGAEGQLEESGAGYANGPDDPPYDIWSIQKVVED